MATGSTPISGLPYPLESDAPDVAADMHTLATALDGKAIATSGPLASRPSTSLVLGQRYYGTDTGLWYICNGSAWVQLLGLGNSFAAFRSASVNTTANVGDFILAAAVTITLPAPTANAIIGVYAANGSITGSAPVTVSASSGVIVGVGLNAASTTLGVFGAFVTLQGNGTNWLIVAGQQDTGWVPLTLATGMGSSGFYVPSARLQGDTVQFKGEISQSGGNSVTSIATLPLAVMRPASQVQRGTSIFDGGVGNYAANTIGITAAGNVFNNHNGGAGSFIFLDGTTYSIS